MQAPVPRSSCPGGTYKVAVRSSSPTLRAARLAKVFGHGRQPLKGGSSRYALFLLGFLAIFWASTGRS